MKLSLTLKVNDQHGPSCHVHSYAEETMEAGTYVNNFSPIAA